MFDNSDYRLQRPSGSNRKALEAGNLACRQRRWHSAVNLLLNIFDRSEKEQANRFGIAARTGQRIGFFEQGTGTRSVGSQVQEVVIRPRRTSRFAKSQPHAHGFAEQEVEHTQHDGGDGGIERPAKDRSKGVDEPGDRAEPARRRGRVDGLELRFRPLELQVRPANIGGMGRIDRFKISFRTDQVFGVPILIVFESGGVAGRFRWLLCELGHCRRRDERENQERKSGETSVCFHRNPPFRQPRPSVSLNLFQTLPQASTSYCGSVIQVRYSAFMTFGRQDLDKAAIFRDLKAEIESVVTGETSDIARYATAACLLAHAFAPRFFWTGFYLVDPDKERELVVGPYQGTLGCLRIPFGKGVCGHVAATLAPVIVPDVHAFPGHIACDSASNSEIVVPVFDGSGRLAAVLDVDSTEYDAFDEIDEAGLVEICRVLLSA